MKLETERIFNLNYPGSESDAIAFVQDVQRSLKHVSFIQNLTLQGQDIFADLGVDVPILGEQHIDFHSHLETCADGANLIAFVTEGKAWAEVSGQARISCMGAAVNIQYALQIVVHIQLPVGDRWGGRAFEKMAQATAERAIERMTEQFPVNLQAAMPQS